MGLVFSTYGKKNAEDLEEIFSYPSYDSGADKMILFILGMQDIICGLTIFNKIAF